MAWVARLLGYISPTRLKRERYKPTQNVVRTRGVKEMNIEPYTHEEDNRMELPASSWWIPSLTAVVLALAVVAALA